MAVIADILAAITAWVTGFASIVVSVITDLVPLFYDTGAEGGLTVIGALGLMGIGIGLIRLGINFVRGFFVK